jgi:hypothetical protein
MPSVSEWINEQCDTQTMEYNLALKKVSYQEMEDIGEF